MIGLSSILVAIILYFLNKCEPQNPDKTSKHQPATKFRRPFDYVLGIFLNQGTLQRFIIKLLCKCNLMHYILRRVLQFNKNAFSAGSWRVVFSCCCAHQCLQFNADVSSFRPQIPQLRHQIFSRSRRSKICSYSGCRKEGRRNRFLNFGICKIKIIAEIYSIGIISMYIVVIY